MILKSAAFFSLTVFFIFGMIKLPFEYTGIFMLLLVYVTHAVKNRKSGWDGNVGKYALMFVVMAGSLLAGLTAVLDRHRYFKEAQKYWGSFIIFLLAYIIIKNRVILTGNIVKFFIGGLFVTSVLGWLRMVPYLRYLGFADRLSRLDTPLGICNNYASVLIIGLLIMVDIKRKKTRLFLPWMDWCLILFFALSVFFSQSDAAILGMVFGGIVMISGSARGFSIKRMAALLTVLITLFFVLVFAARPYFLRRGNAVRIGLWQAYTETALKHPLTGVGLRQMRNHYDEWKRPIPFGYEDELPAMDAHNFVLQYAAENGLPAVLIMMAFLGYYFLRNSRYRGRWFGIYCGLAAFLVQALFSNNFLIIRQMMYFWFFMGVWAAENRLHAERKAELSEKTN